VIKVALFGPCSGGTFFCASARSSFVSYLTNRN
jgi:hypothetical protein